MFTEVDGCKINYKIAGNGDKTIVMLQGWGTNIEVYDSIGSIFPSEYRFIQFDFPGFGGSDEPADAWCVADYADFFCGLMGKLGVTDATLIGHSFGGRVIIKLASRDELPFKINNIVLIDSAGIVHEKTPEQKKKIQRYKTIKKVLEYPPIYRMFRKEIDSWKNKQGSEDYRNATPIMRQCLVKAVNEDLTSLLPMIKQDVLLIWGDNDSATPISDAKLMDERLKNSGLVILEGAGHFSFLDKPYIFRRVLESYFHIGGVK